jgi:hypothetical protein
MGSEDASFVRIGREVMLAVEVRRVIWRSSSKRQIRSFSVRMDSETGYCLVDG